MCDTRVTNLCQRRNKALPHGAIRPRLCSVHDDDALDRLAVLEGRPAPQGRFVVAEVGGTVVAALPLGRGAPLADPFRATAHLLPLLELRAAQLSSERSSSGRFPAWGTWRSWSRA